MTDNKQAIEKFKNRTDFKRYDQVMNLPEFAGILGDETVLIDIDDFDQSEIVFKIVKDLKLRCRVYKTTRGKHFLFRNVGIETNRTHASIAIGLTSDIKLGSRNSYSVLKFDNKEREILWDTDENDIQDVPKWLTPIKVKMDFVDMDAGSGRNQALFNYILTLQSNDFSVEEARETIRIINQYVLKDQLSDSEIEVILRDDAFEKPIFFKGSSFQHDKFATFLKNNHHIKRINNRLHIYRDGIYVSETKYINNAMIKHIPNLNRTKKNEVLSYLDDLIVENTSQASANMIAFKNGIYDFTNDTFVDFSPEHVITNKIDWDFNPAAYSELTDHTLNRISCQDPQIRQLLEEVCGACMYRSNTLAGGKAFILTGEKNNGKSTFLDMIKTLLGENNIASLDLGELGDRFKTAELFGKLANIGDDISDEFIANSSVFKKLVTGERVSVERKGVDPFEFNNYSKMLFSANNIPRIGKGRDTGAILRRLAIIPFNAKFSIDDPDFTPNIKYLLRDRECIEYLIIIGIQGLKRVIKNKQYTYSEKVDNEIAEYEVTNNPILGFIKEYVDEGFQFINEPTSVAYRHYHEYCLRNSNTPMSNVEFSKQVNKQMGYKTDQKKINGKKYMVFVDVGTS